MNLKRTRSIIILSLLLVGVGIVSTSMLPKATQYYVTVEELLAQEAKFSNIEIKVAGKVVPASIVHQQESMAWAFKVAHGDRVLDVSYEGPMPDTFKEDADVVLTGTYEGQQHLVANHVLAKCASRYEEKLQAPLS